MEFGYLMLKNPNYFGNMPELGKAEITLVEDTYYEDIACIGFNPEQDTLYAIIRIKQNYGYGGDLCSKGSYEYVRFYVDWDNDGDFDEEFEDVGVASVNVHDIPGSKPLYYCVMLKLDSKKKPCNYPQVLKVRAILSWSAVPPEKNPDWKPVWGEVDERYIQIRPSPFLVADLIDIIGPEIIKEKIGKLKDYLDLETPVLKPIEPSLEELEREYKGKGVPEHRIKFKQIASNIEKFSKDALSVSPVLKSFVADALKCKFDTSYEELQCVGL